MTNTTKAYKIATTYQITKTCKNKWNIQSMENQSQTANNRRHTNQPTQPKHTKQSWHKK